MSNYGSLAAMTDTSQWVEAVAAQAGLKMSPERAAEVAREAERIRAGVAKTALPHFGFFDEPLHFLAALEECAESEA